MMKTKSISKCIENHHLNKSNLSIKAFYLSKTRFLVRIDVLLLVSQGRYFIITLPRKLPQFNKENQSSKNKLDTQKNIFRTLRNYCFNFVCKSKNEGRALGS